MEQHCIAAVTWSVGPPATQAEEDTRGARRERRVMRREDGRIFVGWWMWVWGGARWFENV